MSSANSRAQIAYLQSIYQLASQEKIVAAALRKNGLTISALPPARHHTLLHALFDVIPGEGPVICDQGFITSAGRYVDREEGLAIAIAAKQTDKGKFNAHQLFSEDLW